MVDYKHFSQHLHPFDLMILSAVMMTYYPFFIVAAASHK